MIPQTLAFAAATGGVLYSLRHAWWRATVNYRFPRILMYHMIQHHRAWSPLNGMRVPPEVFESQLNWLRDHGWHFLTVSELVENWGNVPEKSVAITFDDGYRDNLEYALPILKKCDARATLYLVWNRTIDWAPHKRKHRNSVELLSEPRLSDTEVEQLVASGRVEIGGHTLTHINMATTNADTKLIELRESKRLIEQRFQTPVRSFAYPFGLYQPSDVELVRSSGFTNAVTVRSGIDESDDPDQFQLKRIKIGGKETLLDFSLRMRTGWRAWNK